MNCSSCFNKSVPFSQITNSFRSGNILSSEPECSCDTNPSSNLPTRLYTIHSSSYTGDTIPLELNVETFLPFSGSTGEYIESDSLIVDTSKKELTLFSLGPQTVQCRVELDIDYIRPNSDMKETEPVDVLVCLYHYQAFKGETKIETLGHIKNITVDGTKQTLLVETIRKADFGDRLKIAVCPVLSKKRTLRELGPTGQPGQVVLSNEYEPAFRIMLSSIISNVNDIIQQSFLNVVLSNGIAHVKVTHANNNPHKLKTSFNERELLRFVIKDLTSFIIQVYVPINIHRISVELRGSPPTIFWYNTFTETRIHNTMIRLFEMSVDVNLLTNIFRNTNSIPNGLIVTIFDTNNQVIRRLNWDIEDIY